MLDKNLEPMLEMYLFESNQLMEQLEDILLRSEKVNKITEEDINEIFRIMHTIKGSSAMMMFGGISNLAHHIEDLFFHIREHKPEGLDYPTLCDLIFSALDFIRNETLHIEAGEESRHSEEPLVERINQTLTTLTGSEAQQKKAKGASQPAKEQKYYIRQDKTNETESAGGPHYFIAQIFFDEGSQMENIRAFTLVHSLKDQCLELVHYPTELFENESSSDDIAENGFTIVFSTTQSEDQVQAQLQEALFVKSIDLQALDQESYDMTKEATQNRNQTPEALIELAQPEEEEVHPENDLEAMQENLKSLKQSMLTVNINKLDKLMDLVGEIVITESMVIRNPDLEGLQLDNFSKSARQLRKLTDDLQDVVMSIRMLPIGPTFQKMQRIVRDMARKIGKEVNLVTIGEDTEVDKNIIDHLGDPLMHLIRNAMDHGIEPREERAQTGKEATGTITLEASNTGGDVLIRIIDDGKGLNRNKLIQKALDKNLLTKPAEDMTDEETYNLILLPGFSIKETVTEFSGRGVGMDVVKSNIEKVGGSIKIDSTLGMGTTINIKIPLTLAIIDGMQVRTGSTLYTIPTIAIRESFRTRETDLIKDPEGHEMIMIRGNCYPIVRLHRHFGIKSNTENLLEGIMVMVENDGKAVCLFADELLGEQQVVVKPLPGYLVMYPVKESGIGGCTILGDGSISLIVDVTGIINRTIQGG